MHPWAPWGNRNRVAQFDWTQVGHFDIYIDSTAALKEAMKRAGVSKISWQWGSIWTRILQCITGLHGISCFFSVLIPKQTYTNKKSSRFVTGFLLVTVYYFPTKGHRQAFIGTCHDESDKVPLVLRKVAEQAVNERSIIDPHILHKSFFPAD